MKQQINTLTAFASGLIFGIGLICAGMTDPSKVIGFLDLAGNWDPSLALVMGGAILVGLFAFRCAKRCATSVLGEEMRLPTNHSIDKPLVIGSLLFGLGWGLVGFCPGPALTALGSGNGKAAIFVIAMVAGMAIFEFAQRLQAGSPDGSAIENQPE
jgi:uncharacterized membrane protein YedE/YeeE